MPSQLWCPAIVVYAAAAAALTPSVVAAPPGAAAVADTCGAGVAEHVGLLALAG
ncbi:hypothetical protein ACFWNL_38825 [Kitasatospora sp. NPDC058397]|uniref:hypothetical protein n=1 Tax=unclassified Kitasatospora TaxID=2633591 RepID=UPI00364F7B12